MQPDCQDILDTLEDNRNWYLNQVPFNRPDCRGSSGGRGNNISSDDDEDEEFVDCESSAVSQ